jgi:hypothetical protein
VSSTFLLISDRAEARLSHLTVAGDHDIRGLDVAMGDFGAVGGVERVRDLGGEVEAWLRGSAPLAILAARVSPFHGCREDFRLKRPISARFPSWLQEAFGNLPLLSYCTKSIPTQAVRPSLS